ncbi:cytochrome P450 [Archangium violaceum]|uniref:cytochrome P450 n=1 Tax=Archangium violaceum TaxID=83451 RepID=UPI00193BEB21|nr:cytochrome P450 [Archangium violaceum]QRK08276.1 cytochrome P450 [Archangium violaceum]
MLPPRIPRPALFQLFQWTAHPIGFMKKATERHGDCFLARFPKSPPVVFTSDPEMIRQLFTGKPEDLHAGEANRLAEFVVGKNSLLLLDGKEHIHERRMMTPSFHGERMLSYGLSMRESADRVIDRWPVGRPFSLHAQFQDITLDVILKTVLGLSEVESLERFRKLLVRMLKLSTHPSLLFLSALLPAERMHKLLSLGSKPLRLGPLKADMSQAMPWTRLSRLTQEVNTSLFAEMAWRRAVGVEGREDILSMLMQARDEDGRPMSDQTRSCATR